MTVTMHVFFVYFAFIGALSHALNSSEDKIDISYMSNVLCTNDKECASCLSKISITCGKQYELKNVQSVFEGCYKTYRKKMNPLTELCNLGKHFMKTVTFESILKQFPHFNRNCHQHNQIKFREILQENMADHMRADQSTFLCLVTLTEGILSTSPDSVPPQDLSFCKGFLPKSDRGLESNETSSESVEEYVEGNNIGTRRGFPIYKGKAYTIGPDGKYKAVSRNKKPKRGSKMPKPEYKKLNSGAEMPKPVSDGPQSGYPGPQSGYPGPQFGYPGPQSWYPGPQYGYSGPQYGYPGLQPGYLGPKSGYAGPQYGYPGPQYGYPGPQYGYPGPQSGYSGPQSGYPGLQPGYGGHQPVHGGPKPAFPGVQAGYPSYPSISGEKGCSSKLFMASVFAYQDWFFYKLVN